MDAKVQLGARRRRRIAAIRPSPEGRPCDRRSLCRNQGSHRQLQHHPGRRLRRRGRDRTRMSRRLPCNRDPPNGRLRMNVLLCHRGHRDMLFVLSVFSVPSVAATWLPAPKKNRWNDHMPIHKDIQTFNTALSPGDKRICDALAKAIDRDLQGAECKIWHRHPVWFLDGNPIVGYHKLKDCVRLLFWSGQSFDEPDLEVEGTLRAAEARYTSVDQIVAKDLKRWLKKSIEIQWDYKNIVKRKGKLERLK